jgi:exonuclease III
LKIFSWNVERRVQTTLGRQLEAVLTRAPDIVALQEIKLGTYGDWSEGLRAAGYAIVDSRDLVTLPYPPPPYPSPPFPKQGEEQIQREPFNLIAARHRISPLAGLRFDHPEEAKWAFPEKYTAARVTIDEVEIDVHNAHLPHGAGRGMIKVHTFEAIRRRVDAETDAPRILCGDFNAPGSEDLAGPIIEHGGKTADKIRWNEAEQRLLVDAEMRDVYRDVHKPGEDFPASHFTGRPESLTPHRYDYIFASSELKTDSCEYVTEWLVRDSRGWRASDHAPVEARLSVLR